MQILLLKMPDVPLAHKPAASDRAGNEELKGELSLKCPSPEMFL